MRTLRTIIVSFALLIFIAQPTLFSTAKTSYTGMSEEDFPSITASSAILIEANTGAILYDKNSLTRRYPASTQKILTALIAVEYLKPNDILVGDMETEFMDGSKIFFLNGEKAKFKDLLNALLIESANDVALAIAKKISGSVKKFAKLMNKKAKELGCKNSHFNNSNGLDDDKNYSCAYDLAIIARTAMQNKMIKKIVKTPLYEMPKTNRQPERYFHNTNRLLTDTTNTAKIYGETVFLKYLKATGIKTGHTDKAGYCLIGGAEDKSLNLISVVLKTDEMNSYKDSLNLFTYGFRTYKTEQYYETGDIIGKVDITGGEKGAVDVMTKTKIWAVTPNIEDAYVEEKIVPNKKIEAPLKKGEQVAHLVFEYKNKEVYRYPLYANESVRKSFFSRHKVLTVTVLFIFIFIIFILIIRAYNKNRYRKKREYRRNKFEI